MGRVKVDPKVYKKSKIPPVTIQKIRNQIENLLIYKNQKPRSKPQEKVGWNGEEYHVFMRELDGLMIIIRIIPARSRAKYGIKKKYIA